MYELIQVSEWSYYIQSPAKIGLVKLNEQEVCLIDSGNDKDAGRRVRKLLDANGWKLSAIYNTHSNADHIGGNKYLQGVTDFRTSDDVVFLADCLSSRETLDKYQIGFIYDVAAYLETLEQVKSMQAKLFVPAHAEPSENVAGLAQYNIDKVLEVAEKIEELCREPLCFEAILQRLFTDYALTMNFEQYVLVGSTVRSYLAWMKDTGRLKALFENNMLLWQCA